MCCDVLPPRKNEVMDSESQSRQTGELYARCLQNRQIDVDGTQIAHGLSFGANRCNEQKTFERTAVKLCWTI